jgi:hypothetical protein
MIRFEPNSYSHRWFQIKGFLNVRQSTMISAEANELAISKINTGPVGDSAHDPDDDLLN